MHSLLLLLVENSPLADWARQMKRPAALAQHDYGPMNAPGRKRRCVHSLQSLSRQYGRSYILLVMFLSFQRVISELYRPITAKLRHMILACQFYKLTPKIRGALPPQKKWGPKHAKFRSVPPGAHAPLPATTDATPILALATHRRSNL